MATNKLAARLAMFENIAKDNKKPAPTVNRLNSTTKPQPKQPTDKTSTTNDNQNNKTEAKIEKQTENKDKTENGNEDNIKPTENKESSNNNENNVNKDNETTENTKKNNENEDKQNKKPETNIKKLGANINMNALKFGAAPPKKKLENSEQKQPDEIPAIPEQRFPRPSISKDERRPKTHERLEVNENIENTLEEWFSKHSKFDETKIIPPTFLLSFLQEKLGVNLATVTIITTTTTTTENNIETSNNETSNNETSSNDESNNKLKKILVKVFGNDVCHEFGYRIQLLEENQ